jgi:hypothetical protein
MMTINNETGEMSFPVLAFLTPFTYDYLNFPEHVWGDSMTDPSQVMSVETLIDRFQRNLAIPRMETENVDIDVSDYDHMDPLQRAKVAKDMRETNRARRAKVIDDASEVEAKKKAAEFDADVASKVDALVQARKEKGGDNV